MAHENVSSTPDLLTESALKRFLMLRLAAAAPDLQDIAASAGHVKADHFMRIARGELPIAFQEVPQLAATLGVNAGFLTGLAVAANPSGDPFDVLHLLAAVLPAVSTADAASIEETNDDGRDAHPFEFATSSALSVDFESLVADTDEYMHLSFKVSAAFHQRFRYEAAMAEISMKRLIEICFKTYLEEQASRPKSDG